MIKEAKISRNICQVSYNLIGKVRHGHKEPLCWVGSEIREVWVNSQNLRGRVSRRTEAEQEAFEALEELEP